MCNVVHLCVERRGQYRVNVHRCWVVSVTVQLPGIDVLGSFLRSFWGGQVGDLGGSF